MSEYEKQLKNIIKEIAKKDPEMIKKMLEEAEKEAKRDLSAAEIIRKATISPEAEDDTEVYNRTANGALVYKSTGTSFVDLNFALSSFRNAEGEQLEKLINKFAVCFVDNPLLAWKFMFYVGDIREGVGERKAFLEMFKWILVNEKMPIINTMLDYIPEYNRYDMWFKIWEAAKEIAKSNIEFSYLDNMKVSIGSLLSKQFSYDMDNMRNGDPISLLAKWMPSINTSSRRTKAIAFDVMEMLGYDPKNPAHQRIYRKSLAELRAYLKIVEKSMSENDWEGISYEAIPSKAALKYKSAFYRHDNDRYSEYTMAAAQGTKKFNASVSQPHEIIHGIRMNGEDNVYIAAWKNLKNLMVNDTIVVCDTSGSMSEHISGNSTIQAVDVSVGMAIYCSEKLTGSLKNKFITFSRKPEFVDLSGYDNIVDKLRGFKCINENTDIQAVFELLAKSYKYGKITDIEMPSRILIISDMQFDNARGAGYYNSESRNHEILFETIKNNWKTITGGKVEIPKLIFWNVCNTDTDTVPMVENDNGLILLSGFSTNLLKMAMSGQYDPSIALLEILSSGRYAVIEEEYKHAMHLI